jgi:WD40 repeat protein
VSNGLCIAGFADGNIRFWSLEHMQNLGKVKISSNAITCFAATPSGKTAFIGDAVGTLYLISIESLKPLSVHTQKVRSSVANCIAART